MSEHPKEQGHSKSSGQGSFWIPKQTIEAFTSPDRPATAVDIVTYLVLARFTDETGSFSSAGIQAVVTATGVTRKMVEQALERLQQPWVPPATKKKKDQGYAVILAPADWSARTGEPVPERPTARSQIRWVLNGTTCADGSPCADEDKVWFSNELVDGYGRFKSPLKRLKQCGDIAARLLLIMYRENDMEACGGCSPCRSAYSRYKMNFVLKGHKGYDFYTAESESTSAFNIVSKPSLCVDKLPVEENEKTIVLKPFWNALKSLESTGLIYEVITVMDNEPGDAHAQPIYVLHTKAANGYTPKGEEGLGGHVARIMGDLGHPVTDAQGRFYGKFGAVVPAGITPHIVAIFRLRFRVANPKNYGVKSAWARIYKGQEEAKEWLEFIEGKGRVIPAKGEEEPAPGEVAKPASSAEKPSGQAQPGPGPRPTPVARPEPSPACRLPASPKPDMPPEAFAARVRRWISSDDGWNAGETQIKLCVKYLEAAKQINTPGGMCEAFGMSWHKWMTWAKSRIAEMETTAPAEQQTPY